MFHVVERGETLSKIAKSYGSSVAAFKEANPEVVDVDRIFAGQRLVVPGTRGQTKPKSKPKPKPTGEAAGKGKAKQAVAKPKSRPEGGPESEKAATGETYTVAAGDTMKKIAARFSVDLTDLIAANPQVPDPDVIKRGQVLTIPGGGVSPKPVPKESAKPKEGKRKKKAPARRRRTRDWTAEAVDIRILYVMERLVDYGYPVNGAAGILGNLFVESGVLPNRVQGSSSRTPLRSKGFDGTVVDFTPEDVMRRDDETGRGPRLAGIGLAQWTSANRRRRLFEHEYEGTVLATDILFDMDAQVDYLVTELRTSYRRVDEIVAHPSVTVDAAADEVLYNFEVPASILTDRNTKKRDRDDPAVQQVFSERRAPAHRALEVYRAAHP